MITALKDRHFTISVFRHLNYSRNVRSSSLADHEIWQRQIQIMNIASAPVVAARREYKCEKHCGDVLPEG